MSKYIKIAVAVGQDSFLSDAMLHNANWLTTILTTRWKL